ncbi:hypothetical protein L345_11189, partial [Ophiophagus hannah]
MHTKGSWPYVSLFQQHLAIYYDRGQRKHEEPSSDCFKIYCFPDEVLANARKTPAWYLLERPQQIRPLEGKDSEKQKGKCNSFHQKKGDSGCHLRGEVTSEELAWSEEMYNATDAPESLDFRSLKRRMQIASMVIYSLALVMGLLGNGLVIFITGF